MSRMLITGKPAEHISNTISRAIKYAPSVMKFNGTEIEVNFGDAPSIVDERWFVKQEEENAEKATLMKQVDLAAIAEIRAEGIEEGRRLEHERGVEVEISADGNEIVVEPQPAFWPQQSGDSFRAILILLKDTP